MNDYVTINGVFLCISVDKVRTSCGKPGMNPAVSGIKFSLRSLETTSVGDSFVFECENAATLSGGSGLTNDANVVCLESGVWDLGTLACEGTHTVFYRASVPCRS